jgi:hypothetical protein
MPQLKLHLDLLVSTSGTPGNPNLARKGTQRRMNHQFHDSSASFTEYTYLLALIEIKTGN